MGKNTYSNDLREWREYGRVRIVTLKDGRYAIVKDGRIVEVLT